jgi:5-methylcytosine-specific restriction endonuclease McrA
MPSAWKLKADQETQQAIAAFNAAVKRMRASRTRPATLEYAFEFKVYGDELLRGALNQHYRYKCAYCETFFGAAQPVAVEHYRPKGEIIEGDKRVKPGYYWLAATWDNLLPSCTDCNSRRTQTADNGTARVRGKGNYFPLAKGTRRATRPGAEKNETPLLLHPEKDEPERHLEFLVAPDRLGVIRPTLIHGAPSEKGALSIEIYALDRPQLVDFRRTMAKRMVSHLRNTRLTLRQHRADPADADARRSYEENMADLREMIAHGQPYLAMMRAILRAEFPEQANLL